MSRDADLDCFSASDLLALYALPDALEFDCAEWSEDGGELGAPAAASDRRVGEGLLLVEEDDGGGQLEIQWGWQELNASAAPTKAAEGHAALLLGPDDAIRATDSAVASAHTAPVAQVLQPPLRLKRLLPIQPAAAQVPVGAGPRDAKQAAPQSGAAPPKGRKRVKDEIANLRQSVVDLEEQLRRLQHDDNDTVAPPLAMPKLPSSSSRATSLAQSTQVTLSSPWSTMSACSLWKRVAEHQLAARKRAEAENARLRSMLVAQARLAESLQRSFRRCPRKSELGPTQAAASKLKNRNLLADASREGARVYVGLAERLESLYANVDAVLAEAGHSERIEEFNVGTVKTDTDTGQTFVDLASAFVLPFEITAACSAFWTLFNKSSRGDNSSSDFQDDANAEPAVDSAGCTIRAKFTVAMPFRLGDVLFDGHILGRRFVEDSRVVFVWCTQGTCESRAFEFARMPMRESGWSVLQRIPPTSPSGASAATIIRTVFRIHPEVGEGRSGNRVAHTLADAVAESFQENAEHMIRAAETIIMGVAAQ